ncbi:MAG: CHAT domain-containing protein, partial [Bacteroidota bacterium]|nr:CHAT domain-containing protein [Bacteroidota bacterium]
MKDLFRYIVILINAVLCFNSGLKLTAGDVFPEGVRDTVILNKLDSFKLAMQKSSPDAREYYDWIRTRLDSGLVNDSILLSDCYYYAGTYNYLGNSYNDAIALLVQAIRYRIAKDSIDDIYARARSNLALSYMYTGKPEEARVNMEIALATREKLFGSASPFLLRTLLNLSALYIDMNMYERALSTSLRGIKIGESEPDKFDRGILAALYYNSGVSYINILDYNRAKRNFEIAYSLAGESVSFDPAKLLILYNSLAVCNYELENPDLSDYYFQEALKLIDSKGFRGRMVNSVYENYAYFLAETGTLDKAEHYLLLSLEEAKNEYGEESRDYIIQLLTFCDFLMYYRKDYGRTEDMSDIIKSYINNNQQDSRVKSEALLCLSRLMYNTVRYPEALGYINDVIGDSLLISSKIRTASFLHKSRILYETYRLENDIQDLRDALNATEQAIANIESTRLRIQQDESRSMVSGRYVDAYDMTLSILYKLLSLTGEKKYLERAFEISEKSKAAALLTATRNNRAMNFHLPPDLAAIERELLGDIRDYNEVIYNESAKQKPDLKLIDHYRLLSVEAAARYDSLVRIFEKEYPRYYNLKYNTSVSTVDDIRNSIARKGNFIEYYLTDSLLYIFLINRDCFKIESVPAGDEFREMVLDFRNILTGPAIVSGAGLQYGKYVELAFNLYKRLVLPVRDHLKSERLIISTDDVLSYIPFETLISEMPAYKGVNYRELNYLIKEFEIIYEYSGTMLSETLSSHRSVYNNVLTFAPEYSGRLDIEELMESRQYYRDSLTNILGAREEAIYINKLLGGQLYIDDQATESNFKSTVIEGDLVHLAMHTMLNDNEPMYSKMFFNMENDTVEDGMLNTYEVYNIPIESKMLFLSSCNTGTGYLRAGEGVMSLARGFFYSGSPCVIMSLWEVDDRSGSDIVKDFYFNIKKGFTKSKSLRKARMDYLADADQMRSHPYFWSTLVIMGNDDPVYF